MKMNCRCPHGAKARVFLWVWAARLKCVRENSIRGFAVEHNRRFLAAKRRKNAAHGASRGV